MPLPGMPKGKSRTPSREGSDSADTQGASCTTLPIRASAPPGEDAHPGQQGRVTGCDVDNATVIALFIRLE